MIVCGGLASSCFCCCFVCVFVWQGTHYWWWLSPLSRLVLRVETLVVFIRMFVFVFVCYYSVMWFEFSNSEGLSLLSNVLVRYCLIVFLLCYHNSAGLPLLLDCLLTHLFLFIIWKSLWYDSVSQHVDTALHILYIFVSEFCRTT